MDDRELHSHFVNIHEKLEKITQLLTKNQKKEKYQIEKDQI